MKTPALLGALVLAVPLAATAAPETYVLDPYHTYPNFTVDHLGVSTMRGQFTKSSGKFTIDTAAKSGAVELVIESASISTGDHDKGARKRSRDEHLRTADFLNVAEFPQLTYKSTSIEFDGDAPAEIKGQLTLVGVTKPVSLKIERWVCKDHPFNKKPMCGGNASGSFKRTDFGMKYGVPGVGDVMTLDIEFEAYKQ
jgi:polyisoprenoid-binding protein YceI